MDLEKEAQAALAQIYAATAAAEQLISNLQDPLGAFQTGIGKGADAANAMVALKTQAESDQAVIATKSDHIQKAQEHADTVRANLDRALTAATASATEVEGLKARAQAAADSAAELVGVTTSKKTTAETDAAAIAAAKDGAERSNAALKALHERAVAAEAKVLDYEGKLAALEEQCKTQLANIVALLPGATSAGLAFAFDARRKAFTDPSKRWQWLFVGSVAVLVALAFGGLYEVSNRTDNGYDTLWRLWLARLPIAAALVWLALHSAREAALAKRLEEDYGYKAAIAASFLGFNEQMRKLAQEVGPDSPVAKLCSDTLGTIASPPGRIYDKHQLTHTPLDQVKAMLESVVDRAKAANSDKTK